MKAFRKTVPVMALVGSFSSMIIHAQVNQGQLARDILGDNIVQRRMALSAVEKLGSENVGRDLRGTLFLALEREANLHVQRFNADRRGEALVDLPDAEFIGVLSTAVAGLHDPQAIPSLAAALFMSSKVPQALADFGEPAAAPVLQMVTSPGAWYASVEGGLIALRLMVENKGEHPLSAATMAQIRVATEQRLTGKQYFTTLWRAIDLAVALRDPKLRPVVEALASSPNEVFSRGVEDGDLIQLTQKRAADRLAGIPAFPRAN